MESLEGKRCTGDVGLGTLLQVSLLVRGLAWWAQRSLPTPKLYSLKSKAWHVEIFWLRGPFQNLYIFSHLE